ncbi:uncharacterized protein LOC114291057 [Camellia sinensis]|uniref:uncharacterized protein LOC114291057 n=1 Tax=Camellia sinensis TaxID=4442 RepID=UPI0010369433|nr:uncharacterized protein LOC114291057 [Camellia sinensis]
MVLIMVSLSLVTSLGFDLFISGLSSLLFFVILGSCLGLRVLGAKSMCAMASHTRVWGMTAIFPQINIRDHYKRRRISKEASEEEIQAVRNFLIQRYKEHKLSIDAIESADDGALTRRYLGVDDVLDSECLGLCARASWSSLGCSL